MKNEHMMLDISEINYDEVKLAIKNEIYEKLIFNKPKTVYAASRIPGVTIPSLLVLIHLATRGKSSNKKQKNLDLE
jgi:tRNA U34 5-carboxymethylaminomethyl modifying enzyme MnmG/GidA